MKRLLILPLLWLLAVTGVRAASNEKPKERPKAEKDTIPWHGQYLALDVVPLASAAFSADWGVHVQYSCNLFNRVFPVAELGYARFETDREMSERQLMDFSDPATALCQGDGFYGKIGALLPISKKGPDANNTFFVGLNYGASTFGYRLISTPFLANYWSEAYLQNFPKERSLAHWLELTAGLRVEITSSLSLGWSLGFKRLFDATETAHSVPCYVPGYGSCDEWVASLSVWCYWHMPW